MEKIIEKVVKGDIDKNVLMEYLIDDFDCEKIYDSDEELITDAFFKINYICLFNYLFISSQMSAKPYFIGSTGILLLW